MIAKIKSVSVTSILTLVLFAMMAVPAFAASWSFTMEYASVNGKDNGQVYNFSEGTRSATGSMYATRWNDALGDSMQVTARMYEVRAILADRLVDSQSVTVRRTGSSNVSLRATSQPAGQYYLYFSKGHNNTTVQGSGTIN